MPKMHFGLIVISILIYGFTVPTTADGRLRMCPPGGSSFTMAWSMACTMRRKRSIDNIPIPMRRALVAPSIRQLQTICCDVGCTVNDLLSYCGPLSGW